MIIKKSLMKEKLKSSFGNLIKYLSKEKTDKSIRNIGVWTNSHDYEVEDLELYIKDIEATQRANTKSEDDKTYHLIVSFPPNERPSAEMLQLIEKDILKSLNYENHQRICVVHDDTDNFHFHIAINKINPYTLKIHTPFRDYEKLGNIASDIEKKYNLIKTNHTKTDQPYNKSKDMERSGFLESLGTYIKKNDFEGIDSWQDFHKKLNDVGIIYIKKGQGAVFGTIDNKIFIKASSVDKGLSLSAMEQKLGNFQQSDIIKTEIKRKYEKIALDGSELFKNYSVFNNLRKEDIKEQRHKIENEYNSKVESTTSSLKTMMEVTLLSDAGYLEKIIIRKFFSSQIKNKKKKLKEERQQKLKAVYKNNIYKSFSSWVQEEAKINPLAEGYILRQINKQNYFKGDFSKFAQNAVSVTKNGTYILNKDIRFTPKALNITSRSKILNNLIFYKENFDIPLQIVGTTIFKNQVINTIVANNINIALEDSELQNKIEGLRDNKGKVENELIKEFNKMHNNKMYQYKPFENQESSYLYQGFIKHEEQYLIILKSKTQNVFYVKEPMSDDYKKIKDNKLKKGDEITFNACEKNNIVIDSFLEKKTNEQLKYHSAFGEMDENLFYGERWFKGKMILLYKNDNNIYSKIASKNDLDIRQNKKNQIDINYRS